MARVNYKNLVESFNRFPDRAPTLLRESLEAKDLNPRDVDFGALFEAHFGWEEFRACRMDRGRSVTKDVFEAAGAVSTASFQNISGQLIFRMMMDEFTSEDFVFSKMIPEEQGDVDFEKVAGLSGIGPGTDSEWITDEGWEYKLAGPGEDWINLPTTVKRGKIVALTREALFYDRTKKIQDACSKVGYWLGYNGEIRAIDAVIDENGGAKSAQVGGHRYHWQGTSYATYGDSSAAHPWDNLVAANALVDWTDLDAIDQAFNDLVDPFTGAPVVMGGMQLIAPFGLNKVASRIANATEVTVATPGYAVSGNPTVTKIANPYGGKFEVVSSRLLAQRMATDTSYYYGDVRAAFRRIVHFPFQTIQAPPNTDDEFKRDIVAQWRADVKDAYATIQPRAMVKSTVA